MYCSIHKNCVITCVRGRKNQGDCWYHSSSESVAACNNRVGEKTQSELFELAQQDTTGNITKRRLIIHKRLQIAFLLGVVSLGLFLLVSYLNNYPLWKWALIAVPVSLIAIMGRPVFGVILFRLIEMWLYGLSVFLTLSFMFYEGSAFTPWQFLLICLIIGTALYRFMACFYPTEDAIKYPKDYELTPLRSL